MKYYKHNDTGEVYAYSEQDLEAINGIADLEQAVAAAQQDFDALAEAQNALDSVLPVFFDIRENLKGMSELTGAELEAHLNPQPTSEQLADTARAKRDRLIESFRWRIERHNDELALGIDPTEPLGPLLQYVQDLRDVPQQEGFPEVVEWPEVPNERTNLD